MSLLIVEDDDINGVIIERMLRSQNYQTIRSRSGEEALKTLRSHPEIELVVADIMMPEMNGLELLRVIKDSILLKDTPVIFCSSSMDLGKVRLAAALGCCYYLLKPVQKDLLLQKVAQALCRAKPALAPMRQVMEKHRIDQTIYLERAHSFTSLLEQQIQSLAYHQSHPSVLAPQPLYQQLSHAAEFFGAQQLSARIQALLGATGSRADFRLDLMRFSWDMQRVLELLNAQLKREFPG